VRGQGAVLIPATVIDLGETHAAFGHAAGEQRAVGEAAGLLHVRAVKLAHTLGLF